MIGRPHRRKTHAAVAHDHGSDTVVTRWRHAIGPGRLAVIVGMNIHKAWGYQRAVGADFLDAASSHLADFGNLTVFDSDVGCKGRFAGAIDDGTGSNHQIVLRHAPPYVVDPLHCAFSITEVEEIARQERFTARHWWNS